MAAPVLGSLMSILDKARSRIDFRGYRDMANRAECRAAFLLVGLRGGRSRPRLRWRTARWVPQCAAKKGRDGARCSCRPASPFVARAVRETVCPQTLER